MDKREQLNTPAHIWAGTLYIGDDRCIGLHVSPIHSMLSGSSFCDETWNVCSAGLYLAGFMFVYMLDYRLYMSDESYLMIVQTRITYGSHVVYISAISK
jgi:hypothetical protein